jgi:hypothetical protein
LNQGRCAIVTWTAIGHCGLLAPHPKSRTDTLSPDYYRQIGRVLGENRRRHQPAGYPELLRSPQSLPTFSRSSPDSQVHLKRLFDFTSEVVNTRTDDRILNSLTRREAELDRLFDFTCELVNKGRS